MEFVPQLARRAAALGVERLPFVLQRLDLVAQHLDAELELGQLAGTFHQSGALRTRHVARKSVELEYFGFDRVKTCTQGRRQAFGIGAMALDGAGSLERRLGFASLEMGFGLGDQRHQRVIGGTAFPGTDFFFGAARRAQGFALQAAPFGIGAAGAQVVGVLDAHQQVLRQTGRQDVVFEDPARLKVGGVEHVDAHQQLAAREFRGTTRQGALHQLFQRHQCLVGALDDACRHR